MPLTPCRAAALVIALSCAATAWAAPTRVPGGDVITFIQPQIRHLSEDGPATYTKQEILEERRRAQLGLVGAQYNLGVMYAINGQARSATYWFRVAALRGHREAAYNLAVMMLNGEGVAKDDHKAAEWLERSAKRGMPEAQYLLGRMHFEGRGVPRDPSAEAGWYRRAAEGRYALAQHEYGVLCHLGEGVAKDEVEAFAWFTVADSNGLDSRDSLAVVRATLTAGEIVEAQARGAEYVRRFGPQ